MKSTYVGNIRSIRRESIVYNQSKSLPGLSGSVSFTGLEFESDELNSKCLMLITLVWFWLGRGGEFSQIRYGVQPEPLPQSVLGAQGYIFGSSAQKRMCE